MTAQELHDALDYVDHTRQKRKEMAQKVRQRPQLVQALLVQAQKDEAPISCRASWILEFAIKEDLGLLYPYLDLFVDGLPKITLEPSIRPTAKICEILTLSYYKNKDLATRSLVGEAHLKAMASACFDWLIGPYNVAPKAYSMTSLYHLGTTMGWIHEELKLVLQQGYAKGSPAYKARARMVLDKLRA